MSDNTLIAEDRITDIENYPESILRYFHIEKGIDSNTLYHMGHTVSFTNPDSTPPLPLHFSISLFTYLFEEGTEHMIKCRVIPQPTLYIQ